MKRGDSASAARWRRRGAGRRRPLAGVLLALGLSVSCGEGSTESAADSSSATPAGAQQTSSAPPGPFADVSREVGLDFVHWNGRSGGYFYSEMMGSGGALFDADLDGDLDLFLVQGTLLDEGAEPSVPEPAHGLGDRLYRNDLEVREDGTRRVRFVDITAESGLADVARGYGMGVTVTDIDGDGYPDLYVTRAGANQLLRHLGTDPPRFEDVTDEVTGIVRWSVPALSFDVEGDGDLDLFVGNYVAYQVATDKQCTDELGQRNYCGPLAYPALPDELLINLGSGPGGEPRFESAGVAAGFEHAYGPCLGAALLDLDLDGLLEIYVANDGAANQLWHNLGDGRFDDVALEVGAAVSGQGHAEASMGVAVGDADGDGDEDLLLTHLARETHTLYVREQIEGVDHRVLATYVDRSSESGLGAPSWEHTGFGTGFLDYDHDGHLDILAVSGAVKVIKALALEGDPYPLHQPNLLLRGEGGGRFADLGAAAGPPITVSEVSRGAVFGDLDNDGDLDVVITNNSGPARVLENRVGQDRPWLGLSLLDGDFPAPGALAEMRLEDGRRLVRRIGGNASYASSSDPRLHFALGSEAAAVEEVRVLWPGGGWERFAAPPADVYTELRRGQGAAVAPEENR